MNRRASGADMTDLVLRADSLRPGHLGSTVSYPIGLETGQMLLTGLTFYRRGTLLRVIITGPTPSEYADLASYAKVTIDWSRP